ncbi:MAG: hypothetical protein U1F53_20335 [Burkholderiaceae bacterium]
MHAFLVLTLTLAQAGRFNLRRDWGGLLSLTGRHLVWPVAVLHRLRASGRRCGSNEHWAGQAALSDAAFVERHGAWRGPYEEGSLFYIDEYRDAPKDLLAMLNTTAEWLERDLKKHATLVEKNIDALGQLLQLNPAERVAALRHLGALPARAARPAGRVQGVECTRGLRHAGAGWPRGRARGG